VETSQVIQLTGDDLTLDQVEQVSRGGSRVALAPAARERMRASRAVIDRVLAGTDVVYGINTGFGALATSRIPAERLRDLQHHLIRSHCTGVGPPFDESSTRAMMVLRANTLAKGYSGIRVEVVERLLALLNLDLLPLVPQQGSVGASGDLAPLAHLAAALLGEGRIRGGGGPVAAASALAEAGLEPLSLEPREGLALINGTAVMTGVGALAWSRAARLLRAADVAAAMTVEGLQGTVRAFDARIHAARGHLGQIDSATNLRALLADSEIMASHRDCGRVQDSYALRCAPQVHGAVRDAVAHAGRVLGIELNAATDNPLVFAAEDECVSGGNFHGAPVGHVLDGLAIAVTDLASISERRLHRLVHPDLSGLAPFLVGRDPGLNSGFMMVQVTAAALVSECKVLSHPASVDSIPTSADVEDHVSMGTHAARKALAIVENAERVLACELLAAAQALDLRLPLRPARGVAAAHAAVRVVAATLDDDRALDQDLERVAEMARSGRLAAAVEQVIGPLS